METTAKTALKTKLRSYSPQEVENAVIYEANIRQYSQEGTLATFTKDIPTLQKLGVKIIWVMPVQPISMKRRKATPDKMIEEIKDPEERKKHLGSYYAIADYTAVHPDYGNLEDFKTLVQTAHDHGIYVILDWVANHTGWDHRWITEHPEYYHKNDQGEVTEPINGYTGQPEGWSDVAHLNYDNGELFEAMKNEMLFWIKEADIDGFRCDVAERVKLEFWEYAYTQLYKEKPIFMLMEADTPAYLKTVFDMGYNWKLFHIMNEIAQGRKTAQDIDGLMDYLHNTYREEDIMMNFVSNHDENAWNGSEYQRLGNAVEVFTALTYLIPGMPLIYNGQEYDSKRNLAFLEKDSFPHQKGKMFGILKKLGKLKNNNPALNGGVNKGHYERISTSNDAQFFAFKREKEGKTVYFIANLSNTYQKIGLDLKGEFGDYIKGENLEIYDGLQAAPWEYWILIPQ